MDYEVIKKSSIEEMKVKPNLTNYEEMRDSFIWDKIRSELDGLPGGGFNKAYESIDRHCNTNRRDKIAFYWVSKDGNEEKYTFNDMRIETNKFASVLKELGVEKGDRVFLFLGRIPELYFTLFGILKVGAIAGPLFSAFGHEAIKDRLQDSGAKVLITSPQLIDKIDIIRKDLPDLRHIIIINREGVKYELKEGEVSYEDAIRFAPDEFEIVQTTEEDFSIMHYTSGTTGKPKGAAHLHRAIIGQYATAKYALDLQEADIYWCTADPGWVTGTSYGMFGPWSNGVTQLIYEGGLRADKWYSLIEEYNVSVWYTAPTVIRMLMKVGEKVCRRHKLDSLRFMASVGEPLNPEAVVWGEKAFGLPFHDNWWQTETGCILIANYNCQDIRTGSMGRPMPGVYPTILDDDYKNELPPGKEGHLAVKVGWPSMFKTYWNKEELYNSRFKNGWYITGDKAKKDEDGYFWFVGRADDVINTSGHLIGPFEVESVLVEHPAVAEAGVIGIPEPMRMEVVKAFVSLIDGYSPSEELRTELKRYVQGKLSIYACPKEIEFMDGLPKTRSGKIMRRLLKARELGLPEGDTSTLEED
ncbi:MAG: acetate--CoA ligase [Nitrospirota bacterium]